MKYKQCLLQMLFKAYFEARKNKRYKDSQIAFEWKLEEHIFELYREIVSKTYTPGASICFIIDEPVKREIFAASFRDRVVHHFIYNIISPIAESLFLHDVYSCRKGKGTLFGILQAYQKMQSITQNFQEEAFVMKLDISGYFMNMDKQLLFDKVKKLIETHELYLPIQSNLLIHLVRQNIFYDPTIKCRFQSPRKAWNGLPADKSLFTTPEHCGLPIGNLTSQLYGNLYLNDFDHYVKKELGIKYYGRYVDDFYLFHRDIKVLIKVKEKIKTRLRIKEKVALHPNKVYLQNTRKGFLFLGVYILPYRRYVGKRIKKGLYSSLSEMLESKTEQEFNEANERFVSYRGFLKHHHCKSLFNKVTLLQGYAYSKSSP